MLVPAVTISALLAGLEHAGFAVDPLLARLGLQRSQLADPYSAIPRDLLPQIWDWACAQDGRAELPALVAAATPFGAFGLIDHLVASSDTVGAGLQSLRLFFRLVSQTISLELDHHDADRLWLINSPIRSGDRISDQWVLALIDRRLRTLVPGFALQQVSLSQPADRPADGLAALFSAPVRLGQPRSGFALAPGVWRLPIGGADSSLHTTLRSLAERVDVRAFAGDPLLFAIRTRLPDALRAGRAQAEDLAEQIGVPLRTLQRRLNETQVTFRQLLDDYRQHEALQLLATGARSIAEVAYALGYNEQSSFNRAFRRWTGQSPSEWLRRQGRL